jgi:hypothetical protein
VGQFDERWWADGDVSPAGLNPNNPLPGKEEDGISVPKLAD